MEKWITVKEAVLRCDLTELQKSALERLKDPSGPSRAAELVDLIRRTPVQRTPERIAVLCPVKENGAEAFQTLIYDRDVLENALTPIDAYDRLEEVLFPGEDLDTFGELPVEDRALPALLALGNRIPKPCSFTAMTLGQILGAAVPEEDTVTLRLVAEDVLAACLGGGNGGEKTGNCRDTLYNHLSRYHALWVIHGILTEEKKGGDAGCDVSNAANH